MVEIIFQNPTSGSSVNIKHVRNVEWRTIAEENVFVNKTSRVGKQTREITINGFIHETMFNDNVSAQQQLETDLRTVGTGTLQYTGATDIEDVRFVSLEYGEFRGNPIAEFTIRFVTEAENVHAHSPVKIGNVTLSPANGYETPSVRDTIVSQGDDEQLVNNKARSFTISGDFVSDTLDDVNTKQADLVAEVENKTTLVITLSSAVSTFAGLYTVRPRKIEFGAPKSRDGKIARSYVFECETHHDYTKEPYTLGEVAQSFAGISLDVIQSVDHDTDQTKAIPGPFYRITSEQINVRGKKYFADWTAYTTFRDLFRPIPSNTYLIVSTSGNTLELVDVDVGEFERDGNDSLGNKRYSASVSLSFDWRKNIEQSNYLYQNTFLGQTWYTAPNISYGVAVDDYGNITSRSISASGQILTRAAVDALIGTIGTTANFNATFNNLVITSVNVNGMDLVNIAGTQFELFEVSVNARQLDNASQAFHFLTSLFKFSEAGAGGTSYSTEQILFDRVSNRSKSLANRFDGTTQQFIITSISMSVSGEVFDNDVAGSPATPTKLVSIFDKIDSLLTANLSSQSGALTVPVGEFLPTDPSVHFILNSINIGDWIAFTDEATGVRRWKQSLSLSATAVFDLAGGGSSTEPDTVETRSESIIQESPRFTPIQVAGFGTVFKRTGTIPEKLTVTYQKRWKNEALYQADNATSLDFGSNNVGVGTWRGSGKNFVSKDQQENRGLVNRHIVEYTANEQLS